MSRRLVETVGGIPIYSRTADDDPLALAPGRRGRLVRGGPLYEVDRLGAGAAYLHRVYDPPQFREWGPIAERDAAIAALAVAVRERKDSVKDLTRAALRLCRNVRRISVTTGPAEPGISRAARFVERVQ